MEFKPSPNLIKQNYVVGALICLAFSPVYLMAFFFGVPSVSYLFIALTVPFAIYFVWWINAYYKTLSYKVEKTEVVRSGGVFFRKTSIVPYEKITNIDITQGPVERLFGISTLRIHTAGYSGPSMGAEVKFEGLEKPEELRKLIAKHLGK